MDYITFGAGIISGVIGTMLTQYFNRAKIKITAKPYLRAWTSGVNSPSIMFDLINIGYTKTVVNNIKIEYQKGSVKEFSDFKRYYDLDISLPPKSTSTEIISLDDDVIASLKSNAKQIRIVVFTIDDKRYNSNWMDIDLCLRKWGI